MNITLPYNLSLKERPYQKEVLTDPRKNKVLVLHRRAGKTSLALAWLVIQAITNPNKTFYYVCPTEKQAREVIWTAPNMIKSLVPQEAIAKKTDRPPVLYFKNGAQIHVKGADNPDSTKGVDGYGWVLDEYGTMKPQMYNETVLPIISANGGWVWIVGTPKGKNHFYDSYNLAKSRLDKWQVVNLQVSKSKILSDEAIKEAQSMMTQASFNQEFECEFQDDSGAVFRRVKENATATPREPETNHEYVIGVDLAKYNDWTVLAVIDKFDHNIIHLERFNQIDWQLQKARIEALARRYNDALVRIDATGVGDPIVEDLTNLNLNIEPFKFNATNKKDLITNLALKIEQDKIKFLDNDNLIDELTSYTYEISERSGVLKYSAPPGKHDDIVCALALAVWNLGEQMKNTEKTFSVNFDWNYDEYGRPVSPEVEPTTIEY